MISTKEASPGRETNVAPDDCAISSVSHLVQWPEEAGSTLLAPVCRAPSLNKEPELSTDRLSGLFKELLLGQALSLDNIVTPLNRFQNALHDTYWTCGKLLPELAFCRSSVLDLSPAGGYLFGEPIARDLDGDGKIDWIETRPEVLNPLLEQLSDLAGRTTSSTVNGIADAVLTMMHELHEGGIKKAFTCGGSGALLAMALPHAWEALYPAEKCPLLHHVSQADNNRLYDKYAKKWERKIADSETVREILAPLLPERSFFDLFKGRERIACIDDFELQGVKYQALKQMLTGAKIDPSFWYIVGPDTGGDPKHRVMSRDSSFEENVTSLARRFSAEVEATPALHTTSFTQTEESLLHDNLGHGAKAICSDLLKAIESAATQRRRLSNAA